MIIIDLVAFKFKKYYYKAHTMIDDNNFAVVVILIISLWKISFLEFYTIIS